MNNLKLTDEKENQCQYVSAVSYILRQKILYTIKNAGSGHVGSSFSCLDIVLWLYINILKDNDIYFSSKGHDAPALYAVLQLLEIIPPDSLLKLRRLHGLPGHPDISTPGIVTNTGSLGMGVSKAKGFALAARLKGLKRNIFVLTGDGELQEGQFWESLVSAANMNLSEITVIIDHNKIQSDTWVANTSDLGDLKAKINSFGWAVEQCNGHDFEEIDNAIQAAISNDKPTVIIADTIKGYGVSFMEGGSQDSFQGEFYQFHSGAPSDELYQLAIAELETKINNLEKKYNVKTLNYKLPTINPMVKIQSVQKVSLINSYSSAILKLAQTNNKILALDADLVLDCGLVEFKKQLPDRFIECGIAEQDMVSQAGTLALSGYIPVVHSFAAFLTARACEQIYNNATEKTKIIYVGTLAGLLPSGPGHSHQAVRDIALMSSIPNMICFEPCCGKELKLGLQHLINLSYSSYLRLVSIPVSPRVEQHYSGELVYSKGNTIKHGEGVAIVTYGPIMLTEALKASDMLIDKCNLAVINMPWLNAIDEEWALSLFDEYSHIVVIDNHYKEGGLGEQMKMIACDNRSTVGIRVLAVNEIPVCGTNEECLKYHKLDCDNIAELVSKELECTLASTV